MRRLAPAVVLLVLLAVLAGSPALADWTVDPERSTFAVLIQPAGAGARLAHPHLIVARGARVELALDGEDAGSARFTFAVPTLALEADPPAERQRLAPRLAELGAFEGELEPIDEDDRRKIRKAMLADDQLAAERFPEIRAELVALERRGGGTGATGNNGGARVALGWNARVRIELRGRTIEKVFPVRWEIEGDELTAEALGEAKFTELGIEPYSTMLGAIRNADLFHFYVRLVARRG